MKKKLKNRNSFYKINENYTISTVILILLFIVMIFTFYQNITLKLNRNKLNSYIEEYQLLKEEIDSLNEIKENYDIIVKNNSDLESKKVDLENKISELNNSISNLNSKIDKLK